MFQHSELPQKFNWVIDMEEDKRKQKLKAGKEKVIIAQLSEPLSIDAYGCWQVCWHNLETENAWRGKTKVHEVAQLGMGWHAQINFQVELKADLAIDFI